MPDRSIGPCRYAYQPYLGIVMDPLYSQPRRNLRVPARPGRYRVHVPGDLNLGTGCGHAPAGGTEWLTFYLIVIYFKIPR
eukprot:SAG31_NODE_2351_length_5889_cov_1.999482_4_plen_80_part_00